MIFWCILLLVTTHSLVFSVCLFVVLLQLARKIAFIGNSLIRCDDWLKKIGSASFDGFTKVLEGLAAVTPDAAPNPELKSLWHQVDFWRKIPDFLMEPYLMSRWAWFLLIVISGSLYLYVSFLFSFAYYGVARVSGVLLSWPDALVTSIFIPFYVSALQKYPLKLVGGVHCTLVLAIGVGTVVNFFRTKLDAIRSAAAAHRDRLAEGDIREKCRILEGKFSNAASGNAKQESIER